MQSRLGNYWRRIKRIFFQSSNPTRRPLLDHAIQSYINDGNHDMVKLAEYLGMTPVELYNSVEDQGLRANIRVRLPQVHQLEIQQAAESKLFGKD